MKNYRSLFQQRGGAVTTAVSLLFLVVFCAALYFARHPILRFAAESWVVNEPAAHADAIIVLSDDNFYADRATHAAELYRQGIAPFVVASGRRLRPGAGIAELMEHDLIERGVPKDRIVAFPNDADSTIEAATAIIPFTAQRGWKKLVVVTSSYNTRRARYIFQKLTPNGMEFTIASAHDGDFDPEFWWQKRKSTKAFLGELTGTLDAMWELRSAPSTTLQDTSK